MEEYDWAAYAAKKWGGTGLPEVQVWDFNLNQCLFLQEVAKDANAPGPRNS